MEGRRLSLGSHRQKGLAPLTKILLRETNLSNIIMRELYTAYVLTENAAMRGRLL